VLYATQELGLGPAGLGVVMAGVGVGSLAGSFLARPLSARLGVGPGMIAGVSAVVLSRLIPPAAALAPAAALPMLLVGQILNGGAFTVLNVTGVSMRQTSTPDHLRGRVGACARFVMAGGRPLGAILGGALGLGVGLGPALLIGAGLTLVGLVPLLASPVVVLGTSRAADAGMRPVNP
jgi:predicted MFS family arabinose efflux permease